MCLRGSYTEEWEVGTYGRKYKNKTNSLVLSMASCNLQFTG